MSKIKALTVIAVSLIILSQDALCQQNFETGRSFLLSDGIGVRITGRISPDETAENIATGLVLQVLEKEVKAETADRIADEFFLAHWGPYLQAEGKERARLYVQLPQYTSRIPETTDRQALIGVAKNYEYSRVEPDVWMPVGRPLPEWLKALAPRETTLPDGKKIWIERSGVADFPPLASKSYELNVRTEWETSGARPVFEIIRQFASAGLAEPRQQFDVIRIFVFKEPRKDGFHFRPQLPITILKKSPEDFWVVQLLHYVQFEGDKSRALMIWYVPEKPFEEMTTDELKKEAQLLQSQYGAAAADRANITNSVILALWPADNAGTRAKRYGTIFKKQPNGEWKMD